MPAEQKEVALAIKSVRLANLLAEEAYLAGNSGPLSIPAGGAEFVDRALVSTGEDLGSARTMAAFGDCVSFHAPADADALLRTQPASSEEIEQIRKMAPTLGECVMAGQNVSLTPTTIRAVVAYGQWSRFHYGTKAVAATAAAAGKN